MWSISRRTKTKRTLVKLNEQLMRRLADDGFPAKKIIYVSFDQTASSSHMMLGMLRDNAALLQRGCNLCDSKNTRELKDLTDRLEDAAIVYIDDFIVADGSSAILVISPCSTSLRTLQSSCLRRAFARKGKLHWKKEGLKS